MRQEGLETALLASALQVLLNALQPLRVFQGFSERSDQDVFCAGVCKAEDVLQRLRAGTLGK